MATENAKSGKSKLQRLLHFLWEGRDITSESAETDAQINAEVYRDIYAIPDAQAYKKAADRKQIGAIILAVLFGFLLGGAFVIMNLDTLVTPLVIVLAIAIPVLLWRYPIFAFYLIFAFVCLFEMFPRSFADSITDRVPLWFNINMIVLRYAHIDPHVMPLNLFEIVITVVGVMSLIRMAYYKDVTFRTGELFLPILLYLLFVAIGWLHGITSGGDFIDSLQEVRSQAYFLVGYLLAVNSIGSRKDIGKMFWIAGICIGIKGVMYTIRRYITVGVVENDQGVGSHEEAFFFDVYMLLVFICTITKTHRKLSVLMWILLPLVILGNIATNRRAGTAAMLIAAPVLMAGCYAAFPRRRIAILILTAVLGVSGYAYYQIFKDSSATIAQPARAVKSHFAPDYRDTKSNEYRDAENLNQFYTIRGNPLGYGYGKPFYHIVPMADISKIYDFWDILPHNQILWVWMRTGTQGFYAFWILMSLVVIRSCFFVRRKDITDEDRALGLLSLTIIPTLLVFGLFDLQLSNFRDILLTSMIVGASCAKIKGLRDIPLLRAKESDRELYDLMPRVSVGEAKRV